MTANFQAETEELFMEFLSKTGEKNMTNNIEVVFSFDTTGSMYPCLTQVRRKIKSTVTRLIS